MNVRLISIAAVASLALLGCDQSDSDSDYGFRGRGDDGGSGVAFVGNSASGNIKIGSCDPPWEWLVAGSIEEEAPPEYVDKLRFEARINADQTMIAQFLHYPGVDAYCSASCDEAGSFWNGGGVIVDSSHDFGSSEVVGECPFGGLQVETMVAFEGTVECACGE